MFSNPPICVFFRLYTDRQTSINLLHESLDPTTTSSHRYNVHERTENVLHKVRSYVLYVRPKHRWSIFVAESDVYEDPSVRWDSKKILQPDPTNMQNYLVRVMTRLAQRGGAAVNFDNLTREAILTRLPETCTHKQENMNCAPALNGLRSVALSGNPVLAILGRATTKCQALHGPT